MVKRLNKNNEPWEAYMIVEVETQQWVSVHSLKKHAETLCMTGQRVIPIEIHEVTKHK